MTWKHLKIIRVAVALLFFIPLCAIFLDIYNVIPQSIIIFFTSLQFIPALTKTFIVFGISSFALFFVALLTIFFGRVYCSTICPLGTLQDLVIRLAQKNRKKRWFIYKKQNFLFHYSLMMIIALFFILGSTTLLNLVEPFSGFGRIANTVVKPFILGVNNGIAFALEKFGMMMLFSIQFHPIAFSVVASVFIFLVTVLYMSYNHGRLFCNLLCPAGALLGIISRISLFKIDINEDGCTHCKLCEKVCKANCIDSETQTIDFAACVGCFNCMEACHTEGVIYKVTWKTNSISNSTANESRRKFLRTTTLSTVSAFLPFVDTTKNNVHSASGYDESRKHPVSPPGSKSTTHFSSTCTACQLCVASCPTKVLQPAFLEYGISGFLQPKMDYNVNYCNYDCMICSDVCPSGAIIPLLLEEKKLSQIGKAIFFKDDCIVITKKKDCGACSEHCPTKAVNMVLHEGLFLPEVNDKICIGCGACEYACPTKPRKAIYVEANSIHIRAEKPKPQKLKEKIEKLEEFPF